MGFTPGVVTLAINDVRYCGVECAVNSIRSAWYVSTWYRKLHMNPEKKHQDFSAETERLRADPDASLLDLGILAWHRGDFAEAIEKIEAHHATKGEDENSLYWLALSYVRFAEARNCVAKLEGAGHDAHDHTGMCALPLTVHHTEKDPSRRAMGLFAKLLDDHDSQNRIYRWLLNLSAMTIDAFPAEVPERYRLTGDVVDHFYGRGREEAEKKHAHLAFHDRARELGVDTGDASKGLAVEDFNGDGFLDIITGGNYSPMKYYVNEAGKGFRDESVKSGIDAIRGNHIITAADYDNDGRVDIFASRYDGAENGDFVLLRNREDGTFEDVTRKTGLLTGEEIERHSIGTWMSAWADIDLDGDLDLLVCNEGIVNLRLDGPTMRSRLYVNQVEESGKFVEAAEAWGLEPHIRYTWNFGAAFGDYDDDGDPDLLLSNLERGGPVLFQNVDRKRFEPVEDVRPTVPGFMTGFVDINQDGKLDLLYAGLDFALPATQMLYFGEGKGRYGGSIWLQQDGRFVRSPEVFGSLQPTGSMGVSYGDLDNDGAYEMYLGTGSPQGGHITPNLLYSGQVDAAGRPTGHMESITMLRGFGNFQKGHGIVFFDFDNDGDQDVYSALGGRWPGDGWPNQLFVNESTSNHEWTQIRLRGRASNHFGVGAKLVLTAERAGGGKLVRHARMDNKTGFGSAPYLTYFGLFDAVKIESVDVTWPGGTTPRRYTAELHALNLLDEDGSSQVAKMAVAVD